MLRNFPVIGRLRFSLRSGGNFRQYFLPVDRDEMPFNVRRVPGCYRSAKNEGGLIGFALDYDCREPGSSIFVNTSFPGWKKDGSHTVDTHTVTAIAGNRSRRSRSCNISGMSFGATPSRRSAHSHVARRKPAAGWIPVRAAIRRITVKRCDVIMQIGTAKYGIRKADGTFSAERRAKDLHSM